MKRTSPSTKITKSTKPSIKSATKSVKPATTVKITGACKPSPKSKPIPAELTPVARTKQSQLIALLGSSGATLAQLMSLTGWQAHTVRGMISGSLRKRLGLNVQAQAEEGIRVYRIVGGTAQ